MKKLIPALLLLLLIGLGVACSDTKSYAELMKEEKEAIEAFIQDNDIQVISQSEFYANDSTTDTARNEYVQLASGVYMQILDKGGKYENDTVKANDIVLVRFMEYGLIEKDTTLSNLDAVETVDAFRYTVSSSSIAGIFLDGYILTYYQSTAVPAGWLVPLAYVGNMAHVRLIVPHKMGHNSAMSSVYPYYYDIRKYQIYK
ncbi:MAG: DUF4827 domain-containing protein [Prevotellaceae bacterium]|jgi:hypothetical protein|nr:DUF4827 domain-containing protein [Prevotellaceae bacterium]